MEFENLLLQIKKFKCCRVCGGKIGDGYICNSCRNKDQELETICQTISDNFTDPNNGEICYINDLLFDITKYGITKTNEYLKSINYEEKFKKSIDDIVLKISNGEMLNNEEQKHLEFLMKNDYLGNNKSLVANYVINRTLLKTVQFPPSIIKEALILLTTETLAQSDIKATCQIIDLNEDRKDLSKSTIGGAYDKSIFLDEKAVDEFCRNPDIKMLHTIFHEIVHIYQHKEYETKDETQFTPLRLEEIKEIILFYKYGKDYYEVNYNMVSYEKDANAEAYKMLINYLQNILIDTKDLNYTEQITAEIKIILDKNRIFNNENYTVDQLFNEVIKNNPGFLQQYPILGTVYKEVNGKVECKSLSELEESKMSSLNPDIYEFYITRMRDNNVDIENQRSVK